MTEHVAQTNVSDEVPDPYHLTPEGIKEPPQGWLGSIRYLGPGLITSASIVGSGELIATTTLGAQAGFALLWLVVVSTAVKVAVQVELARWTIATGKPGMTGFNDVPPKVGRLGWINLLWLVMAASKILQLGGIVGGAAVAMSVMLPLGGEPLGTTSIAIWVAIIVVATIAMLYSNRYGFIEAIATGLVVIFSLVTVLIALGLPFTPFAYGWSEIAQGLAFTIPAGTVGAAVAMFGITGVGSDEITFYTYWCVEKGYARWAGPNDGSHEWADRANGWIKVMQRDAIVSWFVYTFATLAFYLMGAAVLHPQGLVPKGNAMITTLAEMYTGTLGDWARVLFLVCAFAVLASTLWAAVPSHARMWVNWLSLTGALDWFDPIARRRWLRIFIVALPIIWGVCYMVISSPVIMVQIGGAVTGVFLVGVVIGVWYLRRTQTDDRVQGGKAFFVTLVISSIAIGVLGVYTLLNVFGFSIS